MKKLGKLNINPEKIMNNEELIALRGGYDCWSCYYYWNGQFQFNGYCCCGECTPPQASQYCSDLLGGGWEVDCGC
jgi:natural product precursor